MAARETVATERDRYWLDHEERQAASGLTAKAYAAEHELSLHAFYQARKRLRKLGLLSAATTRRSPKPERKGAGQAVSFAKVEFRPPATSSAEFRLSLPGGAVLEWSGAELPPAVVDLVERLTTPR